MKTDSLEFQDITVETLPFVQQLLFERNKTLPTYTEWKYGDESPKGFRGVIALKGNDPVGCFGLMPKWLCTAERKIPCGWFADWYVTPSMRGSGLGTRLLKEITEKGYSLFLGHPGPQHASKLCLQNGWQAIPFQSSRRYIVTPYAYYSRRTRHVIKRILLTFHYLLDSIKLQWPDKNHNPLSRKKQSCFVDQNLNWLELQPVDTQARRTFGKWEGRNLSIHYCDDVMPSGESRRRIVLMDNIQADLQDTLTFFSESKASAINYIEVFTTNESTDSVLARAGAIRYREGPIVCYPSSTEMQNTLIQGIDRENWLYLAGEL